MANEPVAEPWKNHRCLPRRRGRHRLLKRAVHDGTRDADTDVDVITDMMVGAVLYRVLQPGPLDLTEARRYLETVYRRAGLLR